MAKFTGSIQDSKVAEMERYLQLVKSPSKIKAAEDAKKKKTPWYKKIISVLTTGETGQAAYDLLDGKNPVTSYGGSIISSLKGTGYDKRTYADVLEKIGMKKTALSEKMPWMYNDTGKGWKFKKDGFIDPTDTGSLGLALDILADPLTYVGGIGLFKRIGRGLSGLTAEGIKLSNTIVGKAGKQITKRGLEGTAESIKIMNKAGEVLADSLKKDPDKYFKGFTFAGKEIIPRKFVSAIGRYSEKSMSHIPILNKVYEGAKFGVQDVFKLGADTIRSGKFKAGAAGEITAERYVKNKGAINKLIRNSNDQLFNSLKVLRDEFIQATNKKDRAVILESLTESIEKQFGASGVKQVDTRLAEKLVKSFDDFTEGFFGVEKEARDLLDQEIYTQISGYMPHTLTPEAKKLLSAKNLNLSKNTGWKSWSTKSEKSRNLFKFTSGSDELFGSVSGNNLKKVKEGFQDVDGKIWEVDRTMTIKEINDMMQESMDASGQIGKKFLATDAFEITLSRGMESNRRVQYLNFLNDTLTTFGKDGEVVKTFGVTAKGESKLTKTYPSFTDEATGITYIDPKIPDLPEGKMLPDFLVEDMKKTSKLMENEELPNKLLRAYDRMMRVWKGSVYGWYPASHGRNFIGGSWNNFLANPKWVNWMGKTKDIIGAKDGTIKLNGKEFTLKTIRDEIGRHQILGQTGYLDVNEINKAFNKKAWEKIERFPMKASTMVENNLRVPLFLAEVDAGKSFQEAADAVYKYHFDYAPEGLTKIERDIFKRFIPFYTWNRKNVPLMIEEMIAQPAKMTSLFKSMNALTDEEGRIQMDLLPSSLQFLEKTFPISKGGLTLPSSGLPPVEMLQFLNDPRRGIESGLTPALKIPIELRTGYNLFKDKVISEDVNGEFARGYPAVVKDFLEWDEASFDTKAGKNIAFSRVNPIKKYWLYALPTGRMASVLSSVMSETQKGKILKGISGINTFEFDMDNLKSQHDREYEKVLQDILESSGIYSKYGTPFKESKTELGEL